MRATYRVQLGPGFGFAELTASLDYLSGLGISHLYCSPILQAARGSSHGYDVIDPTRISDDLGGEEGFRSLLEAAHDRGLRILLDIVPNHMSVSDRRNRWWWDVLVAGRGSPFARYFDINWDHPLVRGRVMAPLLDRPLEEALERRLVRLVVDAGVVVAHGESRLPLSRETLPTVVAGTGLAELAARLHDAEFAEERMAAGDDLAERLAADGEAEALIPALEGWNRDPDALRRLLDDQNYALTDWHEAATVMNYRNFFDITSLVGVRVEDPEVLDATHVLVDSLLDRGDVDAVRVDHVDGLRQPRAYLERMRRRHPDHGLWVEKILARDEPLPDSWPVDGTTGYEFGALAGGLFIDPAGWVSLRQSWADATGHPDDFEVIIRHAKLEVMDGALRPNVDRLVRMLGAVCRDRDREELSGRTRPAAQRGRRVPAGPGRLPHLHRRRRRRARRRRPGPDLRRARPRRHRRRRCRGPRSAGRPPARAPGPRAGERPRAPAPAGQHRGPGQGGGGHRPLPLPGAQRRLRGRGVAPAPRGRRGRVPRRQR